MPVASLPEIMNRAFEKRYGDAAFNTVDDITKHGVIRAAEQSKSPLIVQISVKTVKFWGAEVIQHMFTDMAGRAAVPVALHLDHCPDPEVARACMQVGWNSVLFDGSGMSYEENLKVTRDIVALSVNWRSTSDRAPDARAWLSRFGGTTCSTVISAPVLPATLPASSSASRSCVPPR